MRDQVIAATRAFVPAYLRAVGWFLAGIGWGVMIGAPLEAVFGRIEGLPESAKEAALAGCVGSLLGTVPVTVAMTLLHAFNLVPPVRRHETLASAVLVAGMTFRAARDSALALGDVGPTPVLHWSVLVGVVAGGIACLMGMTEAVYRDLPEDWRRRLALTFGDGNPGAMTVGELWVCVLAPFIGLILGLRARSQGRSAAGDAMLLVSTIISTITLVVALRMLQFLVEGPR